MKKYLLHMVLLSALAWVACSEDKQAKKIEEANLRFQIAQSLLTKGETTQAMAELLKAEALNPNDAEIANLLGLAYLERGMAGEAETRFRRAVKLDPEFAEAHNHLGAILIEKGQYDEAIRECTKAVENVTYGTPERAYQNIGVAYERKGDVPRAIEAYRKALLHNENFVLARRSLATIYLGNNKWDAASKELEVARRACNASPKGSWGTACPESYYQLAMTYVKMKKRSQAVEVFRDCVKADEEGDYGKKCRANLSVLE